MFRRLTERSAGRRDTRRPSRLRNIAKVAGVESDEVAAVAEEFRQPDRSFITPPHGVPLTPDTVLDISHESLTRLWGTLNGWVNKETRSAAIYQRLIQTAHLWETGDADLLGAINLERALAWQKEEKPTLEWARRYGSDEDFSSAMTFLAESEREWNAKQERLKAERERQQQEEIERQNRQEREERLEERAKAAKRFKKLSVVLAFVGLLAFIAAALAIVQAQKAVSASRDANSQRLKAEEAMKNVKAADERIEALIREQRDVAEAHAREAENDRDRLADERKKAEDEAKRANARTIEATRAREQAQINLKKYQDEAEAAELSIQGNKAYEELEYTNAITYFHRAFILYERNNDLDNQANMLGFIGLCYEKIKQYQKALDSFLGALKIYKATGDRLYEGMSLWYIGRQYDGLGDNTRALEYFQEALKQLHNISERAYEASVLDQMSEIYKKMGDQQKADEFKKRAAEIRRSSGP